MAPLLFKWLFLFTAFNANITSADPVIEAHPFYVSVTEINHNATDKSLEISCKIFTDDFEAAINKSYNTKVDLFNPKDKQQVDKLVSAYISKNLQVRADGKALKIEFVGFERESEAIWSYFQVTNSTAPKKVEVSNSLLYDSFAEQINLLHFTVNGARKSVRLTNPESVAKFEFR